MAKLYDVTLSIVDGRDIVDSFEEEAVRNDQLGSAMDALLESAAEEYNLTDFGFQFTFE
jgi:hypothetical protein